MPRIGVLQAASRVGAQEENLSLIRRSAVRAAEAGADLLITPELFATGYAPARAAESDGAGLRKQLAAIADEEGIGVVASTVEDEAGTRFIAASLFDETGAELLRYRKAHLLGEEERRAFTPGAGVPRAALFRGLRVALGIRYDIEFPEYARSAVRAGADLLCIPTAVRATGDVGGPQPLHTYNAERISTLLVPARSLENGVYIAYANYARPDFTGTSVIASPYGTLLAAAARGEELLLTDIHPDEVQRARRLNTYAQDIRPELYR
ncbi:nitrilase-related carbon-nitrogen hydrolase [Arthrobacter sp. 7Tela_A1]|uniref:nitrilase-related carbon-nitrogen hydrolase n=1 Tax=Arthrobacter sp. 7Tela_A1 TaxID=3093745 RepID=UPI003BB4EBC6